MLFYQEILGFRYVLRTGDIDFAIVQGVSRKTELVADLETQFVEEGLEPEIDRETLACKNFYSTYTKSNFSSPAKAAGMTFSWSKNTT